MNSSVMNPPHQKSQIEVQNSILSMIMLFTKANSIDIFKLGSIPDGLTQTLESVQMAPQARRQEITC